MKDYYKILEVDPEASQEVLNNAYRALVRKTHPDLYHTQRKEVMTEQLRELNEAYDILSNPTTRKQYDQKYRDRRASGKPIGSAPPKQSTKTALRRLLLWALGTYMVLTFLLRPMLVHPLGKAFVLIAVLFFLMRIYGKRKTQ